MPQGGIMEDIRNGEPPQMRVDLEIVSSPEQEGAVIRTVGKTEDIQAAMDILEHGLSNIVVSKDDETYLCRLDHIYYIESVDKKTFIYTKAECYQTKKRLYELEQELNANFLRCSKSMIVNIRKIRAVRSEINGRMNAQLLNGETIVISRSYVKNLKKRLGLA